MWHVNVQPDGFAVGAHVRVRDASKVAGNECKQVGRNAMRAMKYAVAITIHNIAL